MTPTLTFLNLGKQGRLGNQMFQIASTIGLAVKHGYDYAFPYWKNHQHQQPPEGAKFLPSNEDIDIQSYFTNKLPLWNDNNDAYAFPIDWGYHDQITFPKNALNRNHNISGYLQSEKYFKHCEKRIRKYFEFDESKITNVNFGSAGNLKSIPWLFTKHAFKDAIGIHIRIADYALLQNYHPVQSAEYYKGAMANFPDANFIVFSDEPAKAKQMLGEDKNIVYMQDNHYMTDLYCMTCCSSFIISNSAFSWWGAWLIKNKNKKIVAPSNWFGPDAKAEGVTADDIYCDDWILI